MIEIDRSGANRIVLLTRRYAIKLPRAGNVRLFLYGLLNNINEAKSSHQPGRCPVVARLPFGLAIVMPRVVPISRSQWPNTRIDAAELCRSQSICAELKPDSFGWLEDKLVVVDYGWEMP